VKADGPYSHPAALDADVAGLDIPFADPGLRLAFRAFRAEVVGLESHLSSTIRMRWGSGTDVLFRKKPGCTSSCPACSMVRVNLSGSIACCGVLTWGCQRYTIAQVF
jgi:hypothetical protein